MPKSNLLKAIMFFSLVFTSSGHAQSVELATAPDLNESLQSTAKISGSIVSGLQVQKGPTSEIVIEAFVPSTWSGETICLRVVTVDGHYEASNEYLVSDDWQGGISKLFYPTRHADVLAPKPTDAIGLRMTRGACLSEMQEATVAYWDGARERPISLLVNSFQAEAVFAYFGDSTSPVKCEPIDLDGKSAFDWNCMFDSSVGSGPVDVQVLRIKNGQAAPSTKLVIWLPEQ
ncbi:hypothetical protein [Roseobacter sp. OBYS 0001]|uniref:hypothetical protein n=1 Tax=Roseobacter sp. OBYS 0001 TaxID=882651 RepID=UPI001C823709|nr:hypothetical protein [Roseobacter sp. OBYS 0001]